MKLMTVLGTRPEIIRLSEVIRVLDNECENIVVHTGQNYDSRLNGIFFEDLRLRPPNVFLNVKASSSAEQIGQIIHRCDEVFEKEKPDRLLILGDTNSGLSAITAKRRGIKVFHMEAGNRCFDDRVPEETNRRIIDHSSDILMPYTERARDNLLSEGIDIKQIYVTGNPIFEVINKNSSMIVLKISQVLDSLKIKMNEFFLLTLHRAENVDDSKRLLSILENVNHISKQYSMSTICSLHPRTRDKLSKLKKSFNNIRFCDPFGFSDFIALERCAFCVLTDSGTVQEECCIQNIPNVTLRDVTERPETVECGANFIAGGTDRKVLETGVRLALKCKSVESNKPQEYTKNNVSHIVAKIVLAHWEN